MRGERLNSRVRTAGIGEVQVSMETGVEKTNNQPERLVHMANLGWKSIHPVFLETSYNATKSNKAAYWCRECEYTL
jgi:hypothetical protein